MNLIPKDKDKAIQLGFAVLGTLAVLGLIWLFLLQPQYDSRHRLAQKQAEEEDKLRTEQDTIKKGNEISTQLTDGTYALSRAEEDIASGDVYAWTFDILRKFKAGYHVDIPTVGQPSRTDVDLLPQFPYKQVKMSISGTAHYHDLGRFIADFENTYPHIRLVNLTLAPSAAQGVEPEELSFQMDLIALVKPNP
ncbi:MAG: hypothetical protein ABSE16_16165 [Verrucomicrobiota bacterium]|jgi:Tfp pilus assembly protein PilO